jgi:short-subunit dehydrogenase
MKAGTEANTGADLAPETVLVTGASSGIGRELARRFAEDGSRLVLVARRQERLRALALDLEAKHGTESILWAADLTEGGSRRELFHDLSSRGVGVDVLVNNAGFGFHGRVAETEREVQLAMVELNVAALTELTRLFLPGMVARRRGGILNLASTAAFQPGPELAVYYATKAYVLSFTEALAEELRGSGVVATCLAPGPTGTEFQETAHMERARLLRLGAMDAGRVAWIGHRAFRNGRALVVPGALNKILAASVRFTPRALVRRVVGALNRKG